LFVTCLTYFGDTLFAHSSLRRTETEVRLHEYVRRLKMDTAVRKRMCHTNRASGMLRVPVHLRWPGINSPTIAF